MLLNAKLIALPHPPCLQAIAAKQAQAEREAEVAARAAERGEPAAPRPSGSYEPPEWGGPPEGCGFRAFLGIACVCAAIQPSGGRWRSAAAASVPRRPGVQHSMPGLLHVGRHGKKTPHCSKFASICFPIACSIPYTLDILKTGQLLDTLQLGERGHYTLGRAPNNDIVLDHPSSSRCAGAVLALLCLPCCGLPHPTTTSCWTTPRFRGGRDLCAALPLLRPAVSECCATLCLLASTTVLELTMVVVCIAAGCTPWCSSALGMALLSCTTPAPLTAPT